DLNRQRASVVLVVAVDRKDVDWIFHFGIRLRCIEGWSALRRPAKAERTTWPQLPPDFDVGPRPAIAPQLQIDPLELIAPDVDRGTLVGPDLDVGASRSEGQIEASLPTAARHVHLEFSRPITWNEVNPAGAAVGIGGKSAL